MFQLANYAQVSEHTHVKMYKHIDTHATPLHKAAIDKFDQDNCLKVCYVFQRLQSYAP